MTTIEAKTSDYMAVSSGIAASTEVMLIDGSSVTRAPASWVGNIYTPEAAGAVADGVANDTAAFNSMLYQAVAATASGPVHVTARGTYLLDQLDTVSQFEAAGSMPLQQNSMSFDFRGARFIHSGTGDGIFSFEGDWTDRYRYEVDGGLFFAAGANTKWLIRCRDVRGSTFSPEALIGTDITGSGSSACAGILFQIWRTWCENNSFGGVRTLEGRLVGKALRFQGRRESWAQALEDTYTLAASAYIGEYADDAAAVTGKGSAAVANDWYFREDTAGDSSGYYDGTVRVYNGSAWVSAMTIDEVNTSLNLAKSYARTKIRNVLAASAHDFTVDGMVVSVEGASLYDSEIDGVRGNVTNEGGSLIYLDDNYLLNTVIENIGVEKANVSGNTPSVAIRTGPTFTSNTDAPFCRNISWTGGYATPVDENAGLLVDGWEFDLVTTTAATAEKILDAGQFHPNTQAVVTVAANDGNPIGAARVKRNNGGSGLSITDLHASPRFDKFTATSVSASTAETAMTGNAVVFGMTGEFKAATVKLDAAITAGTLTLRVKKNTGLLGAGGATGISVITMTSGSEVYDLPASVIELDPFDDLTVTYETDASFAGPSEISLTTKVEETTGIYWSDSSGDLMATTAGVETLRVTVQVERP